MRFPNEILIKIFETGRGPELGDDQPTMELAPPRLHQFVQPLSQVCTLWRQLIIKTPFFWLLGLCIYTPCPPEMFTQWESSLGSSGSSDIDLTIDVAYYDPAENRRKFQTWLETNLPPHKKRVRRLSVLIHGFGNHTFPSFSIPRLLQGVWERLQILDIADEVRVANSDNSPLVISAPRLQHLMLRSGFEWFVPHT
jgi:hypothetical protein